MHAKILLLNGSQRGETLCACAERLLTDISAAFDHTFSLYRGKIGEKSRADQGEVLTEKTISTCENSQAVLLFDAGDDGVQALCDALDLPLRIRSVCIPEAICGRHEKPMRVWLGTVLSLDDETLRRAMQSAFRFAREEDARLLHIAPTGATREDWVAAARVQGASDPAVSADAISAPDAMADLIRQPARLGLVLCPPYAGSILEAAVTALCPHPEVLYDFAWDEEIGLYAPCCAEETGDSPFSAAMAVARMLRMSLHLSREAACLDAAIQNVMANCPDQDDENMPSALDRICEQIAIAGELMGKGGIVS